MLILNVRMFFYVLYAYFILYHYFKISFDFLRNFGRTSQVYLLCYSSDFLLLILIFFLFTISNEYLTSIIAF